MPPRQPNAPTQLMARYKERLRQEMTEQGFTDRSLAEALTKAGCPVPHTAIFKTRKGNRQPSIDEAYFVSSALGFPDLDSFIAGPHTVRISRAIGRLQDAVMFGAGQVRTEVHEALRDLSYALEDEDARAALESKNPGWRDEYEKGLKHDLRWVARDLNALIGETFNRLHEIFHGVTETDPAETRDLVKDMVRQGVQDRDPSIMAWIKEIQDEVQS